MAHIKAIVTISWKLDSYKSTAETLAEINSQLEKIVNTDPPEDEFADFSIQINMARMRERYHLIHLAEFPLDQFFPYITHGEIRREYVVGDTTYHIRMNSERYHVFKASKKCAACGLEGTRLMLDFSPCDSTAHFNLYAEEKGRLVVMTKDHKVPKSRGGADSMSNYECMCAICNNLKGNYDLTNEQVLYLRELMTNKDKLPRKKLRALIDEKRRVFAAKLETENRISELHT